MPVASLDRRLDFLVGLVPSTLHQQRCGVIRKHRERGSFSPDAVTTPPWSRSHSTEWNLFRVTASEIFKWCPCLL